MTTYNIPIANALALFQQLLKLLKEDQYYITADNRKSNRVQVEQVDGTHGDTLRKTVGQMERDRVLTGTGRETGRANVEKNYKFDDTVAFSFVLVTF